METGSYVVVGLGVSSGVSSGVGSWVSGLGVGGLGVSLVGGHGGDQKGDNDELIN